MFSVSNSKIIFICEIIIEVIISIGLVITAALKPEMTQQQIVIMVILAIIAGGRMALKMLTNPTQPPPDAILPATGKH